MDDETYPNALPTGTRIGPVVLEKPIGQGAWGIVYDGRHDVFGRVAVKEYFPSTYASRQSRGSVGSSAPQWQEAVRRGLEHFSREARSLKAIRHENVVPVVDFLEQDGAAFLVMEFVDGEPLSTLIESGRLRDPASVMAIGSALIDTLQSIHAKNVLHRDIAPDNIMVRPDGSPVLIDFGGAAAAVANATRSTQNIVKDGYSPPEQYDTSANPAFPVGPWSDIYATAAVLYRLASGREPAVSNARLLAAGARKGNDPLTSLVTLAPTGYPVAWLTAVDRALTLLPKDRPQSAAEWRKLFEPDQKRPNHNRVLVGTTVASLLVATAVVASPYLRGLKHDAPTPVPTPAPSIAARPLCDSARDDKIWKQVSRSKSSNDYQHYVQVCGKRATHAVVALQREKLFKNEAAKPRTPKIVPPSDRRWAIVPIQPPLLAPVAPVVPPSYHGPSPQKPPAKPVPATPQARKPKPGPTPTSVVITPVPTTEPATPAPTPAPTPTPAATPALVAPRITRFDASPRSVAPNENVEVCYTALNSAHLLLSPPRLALNDANGCVTKNPTVTTDYRLYAYGADNTRVFMTAHVEVVPKPVPVNTPPPNISGAWVGSGSSSDMHLTLIPATGGAYTLNVFANCCQWGSTTVVPAFHPDGSFSALAEVKSPLYAGSWYQTARISLYGSPSSISATMVRVWYNANGTLKAKPASISTAFTRQ